MKIVFSDDTLKKLEYSAMERTPVSGFLRTSRLGKYTVIRDMIHSPFSGCPPIDAVERICEMWGNEWGGVFMTGTIETIPECLLEIIIVTINGRGYTVSFIDSEKREAVYLTEGRFVRERS